MVNAVVLVNVEKGKTDTVAQTLTNTEGISEVYSVAGRYDLVAIVRVKEHGNGMEIARLLEDNNILCNYQALPDDETFLEPSGVRLGVQEMTRFGMKEEDFGVLAGLLRDVVKENKTVRDEVKAFRQGFRQMHYCLEAEEAVPLAVRILSSAVPYPEFDALFLENLEMIAQDRS